MLLLILLAGCLASCAAQTTPSAFYALGTSTTTPVPLTEINLSSNTTPAQSANNVVAFFEATVRSNQELNEATLALVMNQIRRTILLIQPEANFSLTVKNVTTV